ncbi:kinesin-like protein KIF12 isoform X2 [Agrilus planipennis]|uniref:Kinesin-like protein n=1 Tax=Agrilus planipennis TaxID=224129 RepID=A0A7F5RM23_AGRPL|nr:kinesin-like protein KIF12 isoform X2 [Agrilus planipennis]
MVTAKITRVCSSTMRNNSPSSVVSTRTNRNRSNERIKQNEPPSENSSTNSTKTISKSQGSHIGSPTTSFTSTNSWKSRASGSGSLENINENNNISFRKIATSFPQVENNIHVVIRVRPLNSKEIRCGDTSTVDFPGNGQILVHGMPNGNSNQKEKTFSYDAVFEPASSQEDVFEFCGIKELIEMAVEGFRCTAFCYGQTGSGKTHTLTGPPGLFLQRPTAYHKDHGLILRSFVYLFQLLDKSSEIHYTLRASFLEIYNEKIIDLLNLGSSRKPLPIRWSKKARGFFVENLFTVVCEELDDLIAVLEEGMRNRSVGKHNMNEYSSRSHTILTINITSEIAAEGGVFISRTGKLNFVDLAGSEVTKKTQSGGKTLEEANNINKSLMVLGYCISSLSDPKRIGTHIPYRDSNLTKLLADSLAGNGVTLMIACISPAKSNQSESVNTLRYASRAKKIKTKPAVLMDPREALILNLKREITTLQSENDHLKTALNFHQIPTSSTNPTSAEDLERISELEAPELAELVRHYVNENETLKKENSELYQSKELLLRDHELVCRENERLLKKLEDVNLAAFSAGDLENVIQQPPSTRQSSIELPKTVTKELDMRQIGKVSVTSGRSKRSSLNGKNHPLRAKNLKPSNDPKSAHSSRRFSISGASDSGQYRDGLGKNKDPFGSAVSLIGDPG